MTRDRIVEISKKAATRVANEKASTRATSKQIARFEELKRRRAAAMERPAEPEPVRLRA